MTVGANAIRLWPQGRKLAILGLELPSETPSGLISRSQTGVRRVDAERLRQRVENIAEYNQWTQAQLDKAVAEITTGGYETCHGNTDDYQVGLVVGECQDTKYDDVEFGDLVAFYSPNASAWLKFWRFASRLTGDVITFVSPQGRMIKAPKSRTIYFVDAQDVPFCLARRSDIMKKKDENNG